MLLVSRGAARDFGPHEKISHWLLNVLGPCQSRALRIVIIFHPLTAPLLVRRFYPKRLTYSILGTIPTGAIWDEVSCPGTQRHADCSAVWTCDPLIWTPTHNPLRHTPPYTSYTCITCSSVCCLIMVVVWSWCWDTFFLDIIRESNMLSVLPAHTFIDRADDCLS